MLCRYHSKVVFGTGGKSKINSSLDNISNNQEQFWNKRDNKIKFEMDLWNCEHFHGDKKYWKMNEEGGLHRREKLSFQIWFEPLYGLHKNLSSTTTSVGCTVKVNPRLFGDKKHIIQIKWIGRQNGRREEPNPQALQTIEYWYFKRS